MTGLARFGLTLSPGEWGSWGIGEDSYSMLNRTALHEVHQKHGAKLAPFAGFELPLYYPSGALKEHQLCRQSAAIFDVSHMGQIEITDNTGSAQTILTALEALIPSDLISLSPGQQRYGLLLTPDGGIMDDLMVMHMGSSVRLVVNAACVEQDFSWLHEHLASCDLHRLSRSLVALQGPQAEAVLSGFVEGVDKLAFMQVGRFTYDGQDIEISRSGYTGEDGFEISLPDRLAPPFVETLCATGQADLAGLVARDSLRLEAGLCLYGQDMDQDISIVDASLGWAVGRARRTGGARSGGFFGAARTLRELDQGGTYRRVGAASLSGVPVRQGAAIYATEQATAKIGNVTSGSPAPSVGHPVVMLRLLAGQTKSAGDMVCADVRGRRVVLTICDMPFFPHRFKR